MRPVTPLLLALSLLAVLALACVAVDPEALATSTPALYRGPVTAGTTTPGLAAPFGGGTPGRLPEAGAAPTPEPQSLSAFQRDTALQKALEDLLGPDAEHYGVYAKSLATGRGAAINPEKVFNAASIFKIEVMFEIFRQRDLDLLKFDELLEVNDYYVSFDLGTLPVEVGQSLSIAEALFYMMSVSDNVSAVLLQDRAGAGNVNTTMAALGLKVSGLFTDGLPATAEDFGVLLESIARSDEVEAKSRGEMIDLMTFEKTDNGLAAGLPRGVKVAHKTGNWFDATHDAGIVFAPGGDYVLVILCDLGYQSTQVRAISEIVYRALGDPAR